MLQSLHVKAKNGTDLLAVKNLDFLYSFEDLEDFLAHAFGLALGEADEEGLSIVDEGSV